MATASEPFFEEVDELELCGGSHDEQKNSEQKDTSLEYSAEDNLDEYVCVAATIIQTFWRSYDSQMNYLHTMADVLIAQSVARRWLASKVVASMRVPALDGANGHQVVAGYVTIAPQTYKRSVVARPTPDEASPRTYKRPVVARPDANEVVQGKCDAVVVRPDTRENVLGNHESGVLDKPDAHEVEPAPEDQVIADTCGREIVPGVKSKTGAHQHEDKADPVIGVISEGGTKDIMNVWKQRDAANRNNAGPKIAFWKKPQGHAIAPS